MDRETELVIEEYRMKLAQAREEIEQAQKKGIGIGVSLMQERMLLACENGTPINIEGRACFIKSDMQNLHDIFADLEADKE